MLVVLYAVAACFIGGQLIGQVLVHDLRQTTTVALLWIASGVLLGVHYYFWWYGSKKQMLSAVSVCVLCAVDLLAFGWLFVMITLFQSPMGLLRVLRLVVSPELDGHIYRLLILFSLSRVISTVLFFKKNKRDKGAAIPSQNAD